MRRSEGDYQAYVYQQLTGVQCSHFHPNFTGYELLNLASVTQAANAYLRGKIFHLSNLHFGL